MIRLARPSIDEQDFAAVREVLASGYLVQGPKVAEFEQAAARLAGTRHGIAVSNGTAALHLALLSLGVKPGDRVIVPTYSWPATANVVELCGAEAVFVDIDPRTFNMDPARLEQTLTEAQARNLKFAAIIVVHAFGLMADMPAINRLAQKHGLPVIEDAACALGAQIQGRPAGSWGRIGCFSFHPRKAITTGEGGLLTTEDPDLARHLRALRNHGLDPESATPDFVLPGFNYRLTEFQGALGLSQLAKFDRITEARRRQARIYDELLAAAGLDIAPPFTPAECHHVYQSYICLLPAHLREKRADLIRQMREKGVETNIGTWHMPLIRYYRDRYNFRPGDFPITDDVFARSLALPLHEELRPEDQQQVVETLQNLVRA